MLRHHQRRQIVYQRCGASEFRPPIAGTRPQGEAWCAEREKQAGRGGRQGTIRASGTRKAEYSSASGMMRSVDAASEVREVGSGGLRAVGAQTPATSCREGIKQPGRRWQEVRQLAVSKSA